jgi:hypothetical protein
MSCLQKQLTENWRSEYSAWANGWITPLVEKREQESREDQIFNMTAHQAAICEC